MSNLPGYASYMNEYVETMLTDERVYAESTHRVNYYMRDNLMPLINSALKDKKNIEAIIKFTGDFIASHSRELMATGPVWTFTFMDKETAIFYEMFGLTKEKLREMFREMVSQTYSGETQFHVILSAPHKLLFVGMIIWALKNKHADLMTCCEYLIAVSEYPMLYRKFWPYGVNENLMELTVESLTNKSILKKSKNVLAWIRHTPYTTIKNFARRLMDEPDHEYVKFINAIRRSYTSAFEKIKKIYDEHYESNNSQIATDAIQADGQLTQQSSLGSMIGQLTTTTVGKINTNGVNNRMAATAADATKVSKDKLISYLNRIQGHSNNQLFKFTENVVGLFLKSNPEDNDLGSAVFFSFGIALYRSLSNSKDASKQEINKVLDFWVKDVLELKKEFPTREASIITYRRTIYNYFIHMIQYYN